MAEFEDIFKGIHSTLEKDSNARILKSGDIHLDSRAPYGVLTGIPELDYSLGRPGLPAGKIVEYFGFEMCLDENTFIQYSIRTSYGKVRNSKGGTIRRLYERFHKIPNKQYQRGAYKTSLNSSFYAPSINDENKIFQNKIIDVVKTGKKECFSIKTKNGYEISTTKEHKFFTGISYVSLKDLNIGDKILIHNNTRYKKEKSPRIYRKDLFVKNHPIAGTKIIEGKYKYKRLRESRAIYEAGLNGLTLKKYIEKLNNNKLEGLIFLPRNIIIHHLDENILNNNITNLTALTNSEHNKYHANENHNSLRYIAVEDKIISIDYIGKRETYDIKMAPPFNNYIANNFIVHNSGKTTAAFHALAQAQRKGGAGIYIDAESSWDEPKARICGVDPDNNFAVADVETIEDIFLTLEATADRLMEAKWNKPFIAIVDSVTAVQTARGMNTAIGAEPRVGEEARVIKHAVRKLHKKWAKMNIIVIFINHAIANISSSPFAKQSTSSGGHSIKFMASTRVSFTAGGATMIQVKGEKERTGMKSYLRIEKLKGSPLKFHAVECLLTNDHGFDSTNSLLTAMVKSGIAITKGKIFSIELDGQDPIEFDRKQWPDIVLSLGGFNVVYDWWIDRCIKTERMLAWSSV